MLFDDVFKLKDYMADVYEKSAKALRELEPHPLHLFEISDMQIIGEITSIKDGYLCVRVWAASEIDFKMRKLQSKGLKKRTYPIPLDAIKSSRGVKFEEVPLYINFKYIAPQFKNRFLL